jgi:hypothetical protein
MNMVKSGDKSERRQQKRFKAQEGAFAALVNPCSQLGQIKDISKLGLSFQYIETEERPQEACELKIILGSHGLYIDKLPYETITDIEISSEYSFSSIKMRQVSLKFGQLTSAQQARLENFITNHTVGEV